MKIPCWIFVFCLILTLKERKKNFRQLTIKNWMLGEDNQIRRWANVKYICINHIEGYFFKFCIISSRLWALSSMFAYSAEFGSCWPSNEVTLSNSLAKLSWANWSVVDELMLVKGSGAEVIWRVEFWMVWIGGRITVWGGMIVGVGWDASGYIFWHITHNRRSLSLGGRSNGTFH